VYWPENESDWKKYGEINIRLICKEDDVGFRTLSFEICRSKVSKVCLSN